MCVLKRAIRHGWIVVRAVRTGVVLRPPRHGCPIVVDAAHRVVRTAR